MTPAPDHQLGRPQVAHLVAALLITAALAGCGSNSGGGVSVPKVAPARTYALSGFQPSTPAVPGHPTLLSFTITQPSGKPLTDYANAASRAPAST